MKTTISLRLVLNLCATAALSTLIAMLLQARTLSADLEQAASDRLDRAAGAALTLLAQHQQGVLRRHRAMARTPEFRANLEAAHVPTLDVLARALRERAPTMRAVLFTNRRSGRVASAGDAGLIAQLHAKSRGEPSPACARAAACRDATDDGRAFLLSRDGDLLTGSSISLFTNGAFVGRFLASEALPEELLEEWSALSGARLMTASTNDPRGELERVAVALADTELRVQGSFEAERAALANLHMSALAAGATALAFAAGFAIPLSRGLVRPIRTMEAAAHRIRAGDWSTRVRSDRADELGDVARAFDTMLDEIETTQAGLERAQRIGRLGAWARASGSSDILASRELRRILDLDPAVESFPVEQVEQRVHPDDRDHFATALRCCEDDGRSFAIDHRVVHADGSIRAVHTQGERLVAADGSYRLEGTIQDITERKDVEEEVRRLAYEDGLTGLGNRRQFGESLQRAIEVCRQQLQPLAVIFLDLDDFKVVNDTLGHTAGDSLLRTVADRISQVVADLGSEDARASVHRLGGDEFAVLLTSLAAGDEPLDHAQRILESLARSVELDGYEVNVSASIGIARWPDEGDHAEALLRGCDTAMYHAKRQGRGLYRVYDASMRELVERRLQVESRLSGAIDRGELQIFYQAKVELSTGRVAGLEALLRWVDEELGAVRPDEFIALAEETGQILMLGEWVLREATQQAARWQRDGVTRAPVAVNVSGAQLDAGVIVDSVRETLREVGIPPARLELEVTESALLRDDQAATEMLREIRSLGVRLALDDFGTGYSSLSYLRRLPIDSVKIDRSFVEGIVEHEADLALLGSIVSMAQVLGLAVVAEGVETETQRDLLAEMGCDLIQGFLYSEPVPADQVPLMIEQCEAAAKRDGARAGESG